MNIFYIEYIRFYLHVSISGGVPNITGQINQTNGDGMWYKYVATASGALQVINRSSSHTNNSRGSRTITMGMTFDASRCSSAYSNDLVATNTVRPTSIACRVKTRCK